MPEKELQLFDRLNRALIQREARGTRPVLIPSVWPSKSSAERLDKSGGNIYGTCMRQAFCGMVGRVPTNPIDAVGAWKWTIGREIEEIITVLSQITEPKIFAASGIRHTSRNMYMSLELDLIVKDPGTGTGYIIECKTYDGYYAKKEIETLGTPKMENLIQACIYLKEFPTGVKLKEAIRKGLQDRQEADTKGLPHRNRIEADMEVVESISDGPTGAKLAYIARGDCTPTEFEISTCEDSDGFNYPVVNGRMYKTFTIESIYERFRALQAYWFRARRQAVDNLKRQGIEPPSTLYLALEPGSYHYGTAIESERAEEVSYLERLNAEVLNLPDEFLPPAEYEWAYSPVKIETMQSKGLLTKKAYDGWKKKGTRVGDWNCSYCPHGRWCIPKQDPRAQYLVNDVQNMEEEMPF